MLETMLIAFLSETAPAFAEFPDEPPADGRFFVVERVGGGTNEKLRTATVAVQCYGATLYAAAELSEALAGAMEAFYDEPEICSVELDSCYNYTDTRTKRYRYQAVYDITHY